MNDSLLVQGFNSEYQFGSIEPDDRLIEADIVLEHVAEISSLHVLQYKNQEVLMRETVNGFRHKVAFHLAKNLPFRFQVLNVIRVIGLGVIYYFHCVKIAR